MRFGLQKAGRWVAGRVKGSKGVQGYDQYMKDNPLVSKLLTAGDIAGATLGGAALLGGGSVGAGLGKMGAGIGKAGSGVRSLLTGNANIGGALKTAGTFAKENKDLIGMAGKGIMSMMPQPGEEAAMMNAETQRMLADAQIAREKENREREEQRRQAMAQLLMPYAGDFYSQFMQRNR